MHDEVTRSDRPIDPVLTGTSGRLLAILCRNGRRTVSELSHELGLTDNAVRAQLERLQNAGLVTRAGSRPGTRKPHADYEITPAARRLFPTAYEGVLNQLVHLLASRLSHNDALALLADAQERLLVHALGDPAGRRQSPARKLAHLLQELKKFRAGVEVQEQNAHVTVRACACPLASLTAEHPQLCDRLADVLARVLGTPVAQRCDRAGFPKCQFEIRSPRAPRAPRASR
jgi:predicted ArsR family transcriptional regulator